MKAQVNITQGANTKKKASHIVEVRLKDRSSRFFIKRETGLAPLLENDVAKQASHWNSLNAEARLQVFKEFLKHSRVVKTKKFDVRKPNAPRVAGSKKASSQAILGLLELFASSASTDDSSDAGSLILGTILSGLCAKVLREACEAFTPHLVVGTAQSELVSIFEKIIQCVVRKTAWENGIKRLPILGYAQSLGRTPFAVKFKDFASITLPNKKFHRLCVPIDYIDTIALVVAGSSAQINEALGYMENAGVIFMGCDGVKKHGIHLPASAFLTYDATVLTALNDNAELVATVFRDWWESFHDDEQWAKKIVESAKASLGKPDQRYISVTVDPVVLTKAVYHQVTQHFLTTLHVEHLISPQEYQRYQALVSQQLYPTKKVQTEATPIIADDPMVFLNIMRTMVTTQPEAFADLATAKPPKGDFLGAWRRINGIEYLVLLEEDWRSAYMQESLKQGADKAFFKDSSWSDRVLKMAAEEEMTKVTKGSFRYRHEPFKDKSKDDSYVVCIPKNLLLER